MRNPWEHARRMRQRSCGGMLVGAAILALASVGYIGGGFLVVLIGLVILGVSAFLWYSFLD